MGPSSGDRSGMPSLRGDHGLRTALRVLLLKLCVLLFAVPSLAQTVAPSVSSGRMPKPRSAYEEQLDTFLRQRKFADLFEAANAKDADTMDRALEWLRVQLLERGQGSPIGYLYAGQLWRAGATLPGLLGDAYKQSAATMMVMSRWMIATEAFQCADKDSPASRLRIINAGFAAIDRYYQSLEAVHRHEVLRDAFKWLQARYRKRIDDEWLCNGGAQYAAAYAAKHGIPPDARSPYDPDIHPQVRPPADWRGEREQALQEIVRTVREEDHIELR